MLYNCPHFRKRISAANGLAAIGGNSMHKDRREEGGKQGQRQPMPDEIEHDEPMHGARRVANDLYNLGFGKMVEHQKAHGHIGFG